MTGLRMFRTGDFRNRYWGTPLNIWQCECGHQHSIGSIEELKAMSDNCPDDIELHRPYIDAVTIKCPECGKEMHRVPEVIDCWFDIGPCHLHSITIHLRIKKPLRTVPGTFYFRGCRPDTWMVLLPACNFHSAVQQSTVRERYRSWSGTG